MLLQDRDVLPRGVWHPAGGLVYDLNMRVDEHPLRFLTIRGQRVQLTEGRLVIRWDPGGRYQWDADGMVQGFLSLPTDSDREPLWVDLEAEDHTYRGRGFLTVGATTDEHTVSTLSIGGTGDLEGLPPSEG